MDDERTRPAPRDTDRAKFGIGGLGEPLCPPRDFKAEYGRDLTSFMLFGRRRPIGHLPPIGRS
jgi:hypothetical protein